MKMTVRNEEELKLFKDIVDSSFKKIDENVKDTIHVEEQLGETIVTIKVTNKSGETVLDASRVSDVTFHNNMNNNETHLKFKVRTEYHKTEDVTLKIDTNSAFRWHISIR